MERKSQRGYELKVREISESIFRVIVIFLLSIVDSNTCLTCDKIRTLRPESHVIMQEISTFVILKATNTNRQTRRLRIFRFLHLFGIR